MQRHACGVHQPSIFLLQRPRPATPVPGSAEIYPRPRTADSDAREGRSPYPHRSVHGSTRGERVVPINGAVERWGPQRAPSVNGGLVALLGAGGES